jgi:intein/homing endonuclease/DNA-directed RNA polymerase beta' subunit
MVSAQNNAPVMGAVQNTLICFYYLTETFLTPEEVDPSEPNYKFKDGTLGYQTMVDLSDFMDACVKADISYDRMLSLAHRASDYYPDFIYLDEETGNLRFVDKIPGKIVASIVFPPTFTWSRKTDINERLPVVEIKDGIILPDSGPLCKKSIGGMANSAIHPLWKGLNGIPATDGPKQAADFVTELQFMTSVLIPRIGFSIGISDCLPTEEAEAMVDRALKDAEVKCEIVLASNKNSEEKENEINSILNEAMSVGPDLAKKGMNKKDRNALVIMKKSGAKGSDANNVQISGFVGQQNLNGVRIPFSLSNETRTLSHFLPNDNSPASRGFVSGCYLNGLNFKEQWYHATGGRRGVIDTAMKSVTGETEIMIEENGQIWIHKIGEWIDHIIATSSSVEKYEERNMELVDLHSYHKVFIPTCDEEGYVSWGQVTAVTRHDPGDILYKIKTSIDGVEVIVTGSKSLLIWCAEERKYIQTKGDDVKVGDYMPWSSSLPISPAGHRNFPEQLFDLLSDFKHRAHCVCITSIERIVVSTRGTYKYVYDLTVPSTTNFCLANGLHVVDTSDSGYIQKKIVNAIADFKAWHDGTTRNANGSVIQFAYGGDMMNAKELMNTRGLNYPFFMNCVVTADCLNSEAERDPSYDLNGSDGRGVKRKLTREETNILVANAIHAGIPSCQTGVTEMITYNQKLATRAAVADIELYECMIPRFCKRVKDEFEHAKVKNGYMAGLVASCSIGEPTTQLSQSRHDKIPLMLKHDSGDVDFWGGPIGEIIDHLLEKNAVAHYHLGENSVFAHPNAMEVYVNTVDPLTSLCSWKKVKEISRHPAHGGMVKVTTRSGRSTTTTLSHSHLKRDDDGNISPVKGSDLKKGDFIPVCGQMNSPISITSIVVEEETYPLDFDVGWLFGAYLSEGFVNNGQIGITNISPEFEKRCKTFAQRFGGAVRKTEITKPIVIDGVASKKEYLSITNHISGCTGFGRYLVKVCGTGSENKNAPAFALFAPEEFVSGLLRGYFDGDGNINSNKQIVRVHSISTDLIETIALLLSRFGIFGTIGMEKLDRKFPLYNYVILRKHIPLYSEKVGTDLQYKRNALDEILAYLTRDDIKSQREDVDVIPGIGQIISNVAYPLGLKGYSRLYKRHEKKEYTGKETCKKYLDVFEENGAKESSDLDILRKATNSNVIWDKIEKLEYFDDPDELVYDLGVEENHTFMMQSGIFTHNTLNSVDWKSVVCVRMNEDNGTGLAKHGVFLGPIGEFIDTLIDNADLVTKFFNNETEYVDVTRNKAQVVCVDERGKMHWKTLEAVTRHLPGGQLVKIKTRMGREVVVTESKSMLVRENNRIVEKAGSDMKVGDRVPVIINSPISNVIEIISVGKTDDPRSRLSASEDHLYLDINLGYSFGYYALFAKLQSPFSLSIRSIHGLEVAIKEVWSEVDMNIIGIPGWFAISPLNFVKGFLDGIFSHASDLAPNGDIECECNTPALAVGVAEMCSRLGVFAKIHESKIILFAGYAKKFIKLVTLTNEKKRYEYEDRAGKNERGKPFIHGGPHDIIPGVLLDGLAPGARGSMDIHRETLKGFLNHQENIMNRAIIMDAIESEVFFDEVISIEAVESTAPKVYDFTVADTRNFTIFGGLCVRDTFHNAGNSAKDVTLGVPRFQEILNASGRPTKAGKPSKAGCTIYLKNDELNSYVLEKQSLKKKEKSNPENKLSDGDQEKLAELESDALNLISEIASPLACLYVGDIMTSYELQYLPVEVSNGKGTKEKPRKSSPLNLITYELYEPKWWVTLRENMGIAPSFKADAWVVLLKLDTYKLYEHSITVEQVADAIEENSFGSKGYALACVPSPNTIGQIEVYLNFTEIEEQDRTQLDMPMGEKVSRYLVTADNIEYYAMREVALDMIRKTQIQGVHGIAKTYLRQTPDSGTAGGEWLIDTRGTNLITLLGLTGVDATRTISDSMWEIYHVLGIEATRKFLIKEITKILSFDGTYINPRHICLLVDGMVRQGIISSVNRDGIPRDVGPIAKGMFEKAVDNFAEAAAFAEHDTMRGVAASVMFGTLAEVGTGMVEIKDAEKLPVAIKRQIPGHNGAEKPVKRPALKVPLKPKKK